MTINTATPWHRASFDHLVHDRLPELLATKLPIVGYRVELTGETTCAVHLALQAPTHELSLSFSPLPLPTHEGVFLIDDVQLVVVPVASDEHLETAEVRCVGEQIDDFIAERIGDLPRNLPLTEERLRAFLPLAEWMREFFGVAVPGRFMAQRLDLGNWLAKQAHLRRIWLQNHSKPVVSAHFGRVCPFEMPEGPNIGRIFHLAVGAQIRDGRVVIVDERPAAALGMTASMTPFLEHSDPLRLLMGTNMQRQWMTPPIYWSYPGDGNPTLHHAEASFDPEPAIVQTGNEPAEPRFWAGHNLLTAFVAWGGDTFEDGIILSDSCARRLSYPRPVEPGDKLSNRHGTKGVVSRILPDDDMPHLADGTPVEIVFSPFGLISRMNFGQIREALMSRIAQSDGVPAIVPPFEAPEEHELRERLMRAGLPQDGMETLTRGRNGAPLDRRSTVGWVYWGRLAHVASTKLTTFVTGAKGQRHGEAEYVGLRGAAAFETIREHFNTRAVRTDRRPHPMEQVANGPVEQTDAPAPQWGTVVERLAVAGIQAQLTNEKLRFSFGAASEQPLRLAQPVAHPWLRERVLIEIGRCDHPAYGALAQANDRLQRMLSSQVPASLTSRAAAALEDHMQQLFETLLTPAQLRFNSQVLFSGRAVIAPGPELRFDQVGIADELAWAFFGPGVSQQLGAAAFQTRSPEATRLIDELMAQSWVIVHRSPTLSPTAFLAFHPVRIAEHVVRLHPAACPLLDVDFDGDQVAVFLPLTAEGQREAGTRLSIAGHLRRDPSLITMLYPRIEAMWGLARLSLTPAGRLEINRLAGLEIAAPHGFVNKQTVGAALRSILAGQGAVAALESMERLRLRGLEVTTISGVSLSPFFGTSFSAPPTPRNVEAEEWSLYLEERTEQLVAHAAFDDDIGSFLLAARSGARSNLRQLMAYIGPAGLVKDTDGAPLFIRSGYRDGLAPSEMFAISVGMRVGLAQANQELDAISERGQRSGEAGFHVLARARRSAHPGVVFARAAASGEVDPLTDVDSRLFVGLPIDGHEELASR